MTYDEAVEANVTRAEALAEICKHGASVEEFDADVKPGTDSLYSGEDVLSWLGY